MENLLLKTDAPFLSKIKGDMSEYISIKEITVKISDIKGIEFGKVWRTTDRNAKKTFNLPVNLRNSLIWYSDE